MHRFVTLYDNGGTGTVIGYVPVSSITGIVISGGGTTWNVSVDHDVFNGAPGQNYIGGAFVATRAAAQAMLDKFLALTGLLDLPSL